MENYLLPLAALIATAPILYLIFKKNDDDKLDTKTKGTITIFSESSCLSLVEELIKGFRKVNPDAQFEMRSGSDKDAIEALFNDTSRLVIMPRGLSEREKQAFSARYFTPPSIEFARDLKKPNVVKPFVLFNNQAREGLGKSFMAYVCSEAGHQIITSLGFEPVSKKKGMMKEQKKVA